MSPIPDTELAALRAMTGYDQTVEMDRLCRLYGIDEASLKEALTSGRTGTQAPPSQSWDTSYKDIPGLNPAPPVSAPTVVDKERFRFEYDPTREAAHRREQVDQAILCSACGVALGIPNIRPIKVTCPACLFETTYTN
jgi:hypothetical protein